MLFHLQLGVVNDIGTMMSGVLDANAIVDDVVDVVCTITIKWRIYIKIKYSHFWPNTNDDTHSYYDCNPICLPDQRISF